MPTVKCAHEIRRTQHRGDFLDGLNSRRKNASTSDDDGDGRVRRAEVQAGGLDWLIEEARRDLREGRRTDRSARQHARLDRSAYPMNRQYPEALKALNSRRRA